MKKNIGAVDKIIRLVVAALFVVLYFTNMVSGTLGIVFLVAAGLLVITTLTSFCGLYTILGIRTCPLKSE